MKPLNESIITAMDSQDITIIPFLPYILQDFWEIGTPTEIVINLIQKNQADEYDALENKMICSTMVFKKGCV